MLLTAHFQLEEFLKSETAKANNIDISNPPELIVRNLGMVAAKCEHARSVLNCGIRINSGWRPVELNRLLGSKDTSAHVEGLAADLVPLKVSIDVAFDLLLDDPYFMANVDQIIIERGCIHIGLPCKASGYSARREVRKETNINGERKYPLIRVWGE